MQARTWSSSTVGATNTCPQCLNWKATDPGSASLALDLEMAVRTSVADLHNASRVTGASGDLLTSVVRQSPLALLGQGCRAVCPVSRREGGRRNSRPHTWGCSCRDGRPGQCPLGQLQGCTDAVP